MSMQRLGNDGVRHQTVLDQLSVAVIQDAMQRAIDFTGKSISVSALIRYAVCELLAEESRVWLDMGPLDQAEVKRKLQDARACRPANYMAPYVEN